MESEQEEVKHSQLYKDSQKFGFSLALSLSNSLETLEVESSTSWKHARWLVVKMPHGDFGKSE